MNETPHAQMTYSEYLRSDHWREQREDALYRAENRCQICYSPDRLQVHHRTYIRLGREKPRDLTVLCENCHRRHHQFMNIGPEADEQIGPFLNRLYHSKSNVSE